MTPEYKLISGNLYYTRESVWAGGVEAGALLYILIPRKTLVMFISSFSDPPIGSEFVARIICVLIADKIRHIRRAATATARMGENHKNLYDFLVPTG